MTGPAAGRRKLRLLVEEAMRMVLSFDLLVRRWMRRTMMMMMMMMKRMMRRRRRRCVVGRGRGTQMTPMMKKRKTTKRMAAAAAVAAAVAAELDVKVMRTLVKQHSQQHCSTECEQTHRLIQEVKLLLVLLALLPTKTMAQMVLTVAPCQN